jgi:hypothetical protein
MDGAVDKLFNFGQIIGSDFPSDGGLHGHYSVCVWLVILAKTTKWTIYSGRAMPFPAVYILPEIVY